MKPIARQTVEELSWQKGEPSWMTETRLAAWNVYAKGPQSKALSGLDLTTLQAFLEPPRTSVPSHQWPDTLSKAVEERGDEEGLIVQRDSTVLSRSLTKDQVKRGVIFTDLDMALKTAPELVRRHFGHLTGLNDPLTALATAFWSGGAFLYLPANVEIRLPFHACYWMSVPQTCLFPRTLIVAERRSRVSFVDEFLSVHWPDPALSVSTVEITAKDHARVEYSQVQNWGQGVVHYGRVETHGASTAQISTHQSQGPRPAITLERAAELFPEVRQ